MAHHRGDDQDVFSDDYTDVPANRLQAHSSGSLPSVIHSQEIEVLPAARSRRPLSHSDLSKLQGILGSESISYGSSIGRSNESGFFSASLASSNFSLDQNESQRTPLDGPGMPGFPERHELDSFNQNELSSLFSDFAEELGGCWKECGRYLLQKECSVENINADHSKVCEKAYQVLLKWKQENGAGACVLDLFKCFNHIKREDVAEKVLGYMPKHIQPACQMILLMSPKKIRSPSMTTEIHNITETIHEMSVEKQLRIAEDKEIHVCVSKKSGKKYILNKIEEGQDKCILAARQAIPRKHFATKKRQLRSTSDFLKEIKFKEETVTRLKEIVKHLMSKLQKDYFSFCKENVDCTNCEKTKMKLELLEKESSLLHHTLDKTLTDMYSRKLSITGIPTDKIYNLADRTYAICEDHKKMHSEIIKIKRRCSQEFLDIKQDQEQSRDEGEKEDSEIDETLECTMNILQRFARRNKVAQSLTPKRRKESKAVQRNKSDKSKSRSRFYVTVRDSFKYKRDTVKTKPSGLTKTDSEKSKRSFRAKDSKIISRKRGIAEKPYLQSLYPPTSTHPAALVCSNGDKTNFVGPEDLDLDDPSDAYNFSSCTKTTGGQAQTSRVAEPSYNGNVVQSSHKKVHKCNSDPYTLNINAIRSRNAIRKVERDGHGEAVFDILTRQCYERGRSQSDVQTRKKKLSYNENVTKRDQRRNHFLQDSSRDSTSNKRHESFSKSQPAALGSSLSDKPGEKRDKHSEELSHSSILAASSSSKLSDKSAEKRDKPSEKRDKSTEKRSKASEEHDYSFTTNQSEVLANSSGEKPSKKRDKLCDENQTQSHSLEDPPSVKSSIPREKCEQLNSQLQSSNPKASVSLASDKNNDVRETLSCESVKWLKDVDTKNIIFV